MAQPTGRGGPRGARGAKPAGKKRVFFRRRKVCKFCAEHLDYIDYKDTKQVQQFILERAKILPRRISGTCARHQRMVQQAIKRARHLALVPFTTD
ncbi:MAG: 30S ribosomal protein S18 [Holophagales bacterium]|jgi:small subunit ribosomal protein S18|nr:MAG: 30S ribosomal protein S18 [Holophagales bacterium]